MKKGILFLMSSRPLGQSALSGLNFLKSKLFGTKFKYGNVKFIFICIFLVSCSTMGPRSEYKESNFSELEPNDLLSSFCVEGFYRTPASDSSCLRFYGLRSKNITKSDTSYLKRLQSDPLQKAEALALVSAQGEDRLPVSLSSEMQRFRYKSLGFLKNSTVREPLIKSYEAFLRMRSWLSINALERSGYYGQFDLVIVGSGVHGVIALHQALKQKPKLKVLLLDEGDTAGATFRYGKDIFSINSSNRASGEDSRPLPGEGNINELPGLPVQVSDLTAVKYPSANDLGTALVTGLYAAVREYPNVEVLFSTKAQTFVGKSDNGSMMESLMVRNAISERDIRIDSQKVIVATGLGEPILPAKVTERLKVEPMLKESVDGKPPRILTFEDMIRLLSESNDPMSFFKNKKIGIVGKGDSANVFIEFLLGYAPQSGYGRSSAQTGKPGKIYWIGQDKKSCADFIADARSRYTGVSTGFKSSSKNIEALITPNKNKLVDVVGRGASKIDAELDRGDKVEGLDYIVVATGFKQNVRNLFSDLNSGKKYTTDLDFFNAEFDTLQGRTLTSPVSTKIGRRLKNRDVYVVGTAANLFAEESAAKAPAGIVQNFVGIFINAPLVVSSVRDLTSEVVARAKPSQLLKEVVAETADAQNFKITNIREARFLSTQALAYIETTFKEALSMSQPVSSGKVVLNLSLDRDGSIVVASETKVDVTKLVKLLTESRDFFSQSREILKLVGDQDLLLTANPERGSYELLKAQARMVRKTKREIDPNAMVLSNKVIRLRGLDDGAVDLREKETSRITKRILNNKEFDLTNPQTYRNQQIAVAVPAGAFMMGAPGKEVEVTISKPYNLIATHLTQKLYQKIDPWGANPSFSRGEDEPLSRVSYEFALKLIKKLNQLSSSELMSDQQLMLEVFPDHKKDRIYDLPTEAQLERAYKLAKTEDGDSIDKMIERGDSDKLGKYALFRFEKTLPIADTLPLYIDGQPIYFEGNVFNIAKDRWNGESPIKGGIDPIVNDGDRLVLRGGSYASDLNQMTSFHRAIAVGEQSNQGGIRLVTYDP